MSSWRAPQSEKQAHARDANESAARACAAAPAGALVSSFRCECDDQDCTWAIRLTLTEYESVREYATHFVIAPNHENPERESVVAENERFAVVEAVSREAVKGARRSDPRQSSAARSASDRARSGRTAR